MNYLRTKKAEKYFSSSSKNHFIKEGRILDGACKRMVLVYFKEVFFFDEFLREKLFFFFKM